MSERRMFWKRKKNDRCRLPRGSYRRVNDNSDEIFEEGLGEASIAAYSSKRRKRVAARGEGGGGGGEGGDFGGLWDPFVGGVKLYSDFYRLLEEFFEQQRDQIFSLGAEDFRSASHRILNTAFDYGMYNKIGRPDLLEYKINREE